MRRSSRCKSGLCVWHSGTHFLPTTNPHRRAALRQSALENISLENNPPTALSRRIRTTGRLEYAGFPEPLSREHHAALKKKAENMPPPRASVLEIRALRTENTPVSIVENSTISAVDWDVGMPQCHLDGVEMIWDTGATATIITKISEVKISKPICQIQSICRTPIRAALASSFPSPSSLPTRFLQ